MKDALETLGLLTATYVLLLVLIGGLVIPVLLIEHYDCGKLSERSHKDTHYYVPGGCYVEVNGRMIPVENWRER